MNNATKRIARAGIIAALYIVCSMLVFPVASGAIQFRLSEALCLIPLLFPEAIPALCVGCLLVNLLTGCALYDVIFGSLITLVAATATYFTGRIFRSKPLKIAVGGLFPVFLNALFLPLIWYFCYGNSEYVYVVQVLFLTVGQGVAVYLGGTVLYLNLDRLKEKDIKFFN